MAIKKLHETLDELHRQLDAAESLDDDARQALLSTMGEIQETLKRESPDSTLRGNPPTHSHEAGPLERLGDFVGHLEEEHPILSARLAQLIDGLNKMGF